MNQPQFVLQEARVSGPGRLLLQFADGFRGEVDLTEVIARHPSLARLSEPAVFRAVALDEWRRGLVFAGDDHLSLASDNLRAMAIEQAGGFPHQKLIEWMACHGLSLEAAAEALGLSRRMLAYYRSGAKPIPRTVALALRGWEASQAERPRAA
ncbi:MAG: DUF2442 domain-containing protein [Xanthomonadaceae bacterium]|jgi:hypothetical protein|nr:DUF2442 domain-containing protein [Xanthomonadaceae bacterium]